MTKKIVIFFDERLGTVHRVIKIYGLDAKKRCVKINHTSK